MVRSTFSSFALCCDDRDCRVLEIRREQRRQPGFERQPGRQPIHSPPSDREARARATSISPSDVVKKILGTDVDERKTLSAQSCTVSNKETGGSLTITLKGIDGQSFHAFRHI